MKKYIKRNMMVMSMLTIFGIAMTGCGSNSSNNRNEADDSSVSNNETTKSEDGTTWQYFKNEDDLTHNVTAINAYVISTNRVVFDSYGHTTRMIINLMYSAVGTNSPSTTIMLSFTDDDDLCRFSDVQGQGFFAVFDDGEVDDRWSLINMSKKRNSLYMSYASKTMAFVEELKSSKTLRIQVKLEHLGRKTFDFNVEGLQWDFKN